MADDVTALERIAARETARRRWIEEHMADVHPAFASDLPATDDVKELERAEREIRRRWRLHRAESQKLDDWADSFRRRRK
jgi:hypothetical protein